MSTTIYDLHYDFEQQQGHHLILTRAGSDQLHSNELDNIQVNMMKANTIEHLLPLQVEEMDFNVRLFYNITSKKMLSHALRETKLTMHDFYQLLYSMITTIEHASMEYMLDEQNFILDENFIFIDKDMKDIYLTYLPMVGVPSKPPLQQELRELMFKLVGYVEELTGDGFQQLTNYVNKPDFRLSALKQMLEDAQKQVGKQAERAQTVPPVQPKVQPEATPVQPAPRQEEKESMTDEQPAKEKPVKATKPKKAKKPTKQKEAVEEVTEEAEGKRPSMVVVGSLAVLALAVIWKVFESMPSEGMLYISIGLSLAVAAVGYYFAFVFNTGKKKVVKSETSDAAKPKQKKATSKQPKQVEKVTPKQVDANRPAPQPEPQIQAQPASHAAQAAASNHYFENLDQQTTLLSQQPDATVLLDEQKPKPDEPYLEVNRNGRLERITIYKDSFLIGRNPQAVNYVEESVGVSRTHIEISRSGDHFQVKDLGSKNGSKLNEQPMVAYKLYDLNEDDVIKIGKIEFTFRKG